MNAPDKNYLQAMRDTSQLFGMNNVFVEGLYEEYLANPAAVPATWRSYFDALPQAAGKSPDVAHSPVQRAFAALPKNTANLSEIGLERKQVAVLQMINAHRFLGVRVDWRIP